MSNNVCIFNREIKKDQNKIIINLDNDLNDLNDLFIRGNNKLIKKVLCLFTDSENTPISLSKNTSVGFHVLLQLHAGHSFHHYNYNLGKKKYFFTEKKQEEEGLKKNEFIWILDFGWTLHEDNIHDHSNYMEFSFHFIDKLDMNMHMMVFYEDDDYEEFEFGWLLSKLRETQKIPHCPLPYNKNIASTFSDMLLW
jgi:hypothetical protein